MRGEAKHAPAEEVAGEMLLRHAHRPCLPALAEVVEVGDQEIANEGLHAHCGESAVERLLCRGLVEAFQRLGERLAVETACARRRLRLTRRCLECEPGSLQAERPCFWYARILLIRSSSSEE